MLKKIKTISGWVTLICAVLAFVFINFDDFLVVDGIVFAISGLVWFCCISFSSKGVFIGLLPPSDDRD